MGRLEYKYLVPWDELDRLRRALAPFVEIDSFAGAEEDQEYTVRSIYYDTPGLACYVQKEAGIHTRRKLRIRGYGALREDSLVVLEIKRKLDMRVSNGGFRPAAARPVQVRHLPGQRGSGKTLSSRSARAAYLPPVQACCDGTFADRPPIRGVPRQRRSRISP